MITITHGKFTYECKDLDDAKSTILREQMEEGATVSFRVTGIPAPTFFTIVYTIQRAGGRVV